MNFRWIWGNFIEPEWRLTPQEVRTVHRIAKKKYMKNWVMFGFTMLVLLLAYGAFGLLHAPMLRALGGLGFLRAWLIGSVLLIVPIMLAGTWSFHLIYRRPLRMAMRDLGYDVCIKCGYWLRELPEDVKQCPECGGAREPMPEKAL